MLNPGVVEVTRRNEGVICTLLNLDLVLTKEGAALTPTNSNLHGIYMGPSMPTRYTRDMILIIIYLAGTLH